MCDRFIKFIPSDFSSWLRENFPNAFLLLSLIAERARREENDYDGYVIGEADIGDYKKAGIDSYKKYRLAKEKLVELKIIEILNTNRKCKNRATRRATKGTSVKLLNTRVWDINVEIKGHLEGNLGATSGPPEGHEQERIRKKKKERYMSDSAEFGLSIFFLDAIKKFNPDFKEPNLQKWSQHFDFILRIDKRSLEDVKKYISWCTAEGCWWQGKILSPDKLRQKWDMLTSQMKNDKKDILETHRDFVTRLCQEYWSPNFEMKINPNEVVFIPLIGQQLPFALKYSEAGFKDQIINIFKKRGFKKIAGEKYA